MTAHDDHRQSDPVLITDAAIPYEDELAVRKRKYALTMSLRIPMMLAALACASIPWLAATLLLASVPLPWVAVLMANDRLPRRAENPHRYHHGRAEVEARPHRVIGE